MKKKARWIACILIADVLIFLAATISIIRNERQEDLILTCQTAYPALATLPDFDWLSEQPDGSFLLHEYGEPDQSAMLPEDIVELLRARKLLGLRKIGDDIFFITNGAADDEWGYVITADADVYIEGLWQLDRVGSGVYEFSTMK